MNTNQVNQAYDEWFNDEFKDLTSSESTESNTMIYGCHSEESPDRFRDGFVYHSNGNQLWAKRLTKKCQYDNKANDIKCNGCKHEHKDDAVERNK